MKKPLNSDLSPYSYTSIIFRPEKNLSKSPERPCGLLLRIGDTANNIVGLDFFPNAGATRLIFNYRLVNNVTDDRQKTVR